MQTPGATSPSCVSSTSRRTSARRRTHDRMSLEAAQVTKEPVASCTPAREDGLRAELTIDQRTGEPIPDAGIEKSIRRARVAEESEAWLMLHAPSESLTDRLATAPAYAGPSALILIGAASGGAFLLLLTRAC